MAKIKILSDQNEFYSSTAGEIRDMLQIYVDKLANAANNSTMGSQPLDVTEMMPFDYFASLYQIRIENNLGEFKFKIVNTLVVIVP